MKVRRSVTVVLAFVVLAGVILSACSREEGEEQAAGKVQQKIEWRMASSFPKGTYLQWSQDYFAEIVGQMSGGRLIIKSFPGGALMGPLEVFDAVNSGAIDATSTWAGYWIGKEPAAPFFGAMPMGFEAVPFVTWIYEGGGLELWKEMYSEYNFGYVAPLSLLPPEDFAWAHKPLRTLEDFKGLRFRTVGFWGEILTELGVSVVTLPGGEVYPALQRKVVDAGEFSLPNIDWDLGFHEIAKYLHVPGIHQPSSLMELIVNKNSWDALTPDLQAIVKSAAMAATLRGLTRGIWLDVPAVERFKEYGTEIIYIDPKVQQELKRRADDLYDRKAAEDPFFARVLKSQREWRKSYDAYKKMMTPQFD